MLGGDNIMQQKMILIKKSNGIIYSFFLSPLGGISYKLYSLHNNHEVDPFEINITDEKVLEFHACIDTEDRIHIICLTENGDLKYFVNKENVWDSRLCFQFDLRSNIVKSLFIHAYKEKLILIYAASNLINVNLWTIYFRSWDGTKWNTTNIGITLCEREIPPYCVSMDSQQNIYIAYKNIGNRDAQIFYKKFHIQFALWSSPEKVVNSSEPIGTYYMFCDTHDHLYLVWSASAGTISKLLCKKLSTKVINRKAFERMLKLHQSNSPYPQPVICEIDSSIWVMWQNKNEFIGCELDSSGLACTTVIPIQCITGSSPILVEYINNYEIEKQRFNARILYGTIDHYIHLILPQNYACDFLGSNSEDDSENSENTVEKTLPPIMPPYNPLGDKQHNVISRMDPAKDIEATQFNTTQPANTSNFGSDKYLPDEQPQPPTKAELENQQILGLLNEIKYEMSKQDISSILEQIKNQNEQLINLLLENTNIKKRKNKSENARKRFNLFDRQE